MKWSMRFYECRGSKRVDDDRNSQFQKPKFIFEVSFKESQGEFWAMFLDYQEAIGSHYSGYCLKIIWVRDGLLDVRAEQNRLLHHKSK